MPLINLQTNLKSLRFEGSAPYVVKDINGPLDSSTYANPINVRVDDVTRLSKMFLDAPGTKFLAHQAALLASDPKTYQTKKTSLAGRITAAVSKIGIGTARAAGITLAQTAVNGTGMHFILPRPDYYYTDDTGAGSQSVFSSTVTRDRDTSTIYSNRTSRYSNIVRDNRANWNLGGDDLSDNTYEIGAQTDLRDTLPSPKTEAGQQALEVKYVGFADDEAEIGGRTADAVNLFDVGPEFDDYGLIPVVFGKYNSDGTYTGVKTFRAFIGSLSDSYQANWSPQQYVGRMEQFFIYTGFTRSITFPLTVPIFSDKEQLTVFNKVNSLVSHTAPQYLNNSGIPSGVISYLKIGDYLQTPGILNSVNISINNDVPWSYGIDTVGENKVLLPQVIELQIQFTPIHESTPEFDITTVTEKRNTGSKFRYIANTEKFAPLPQKDFTPSTRKAVTPSTPKIEISKLSRPSREVLDTSNLTGVGITDDVIERGRVE